MSKTFKFLVLDVDGVLTDGGMFYTESGDEFKKFNSRDGLGIRYLTKTLQMPVGIISHGHNINLIRRRAELLGIDLVYTGTEPKSEVLTKWCTELNIPLEDTAFMGDDVNDLSCLSIVGFPACPADAVARVKAVSKHVTSLKGGEGCVREFIELFYSVS